MSERIFTHPRETRMSLAVQTSIVIPVFNKWALTEACLASLARTLPGDACEIIVVDNASTDKTREACPPLGERLFGGRFVYHRAERNLNFAPASNLGARLGHGEYCLFLNNDTLAEPGWYEPLLRDFAEYQNIAATGPVLMYPATGPQGATVQHLGVFVNPTLKVGHLYEGIPVKSALANKRRFFQIITAACMLMPRGLFLGHGGFDEGYINGFEDVDLCARLWAAGYRMTVNPAARVFHLASQTPGRHSHEKDNFLRLKATSIQYLIPDWHIHVKNDGLELRLTEWQTISPGMPENQVNALAPLLSESDPAALVGVLSRYPLWHQGYEHFADVLSKAGEADAAHAVRLSHAQLRPLPEALFALLDSARAVKNHRTADYVFNNLFQYCFAFTRYRKSAEAMRVWAAGIGLDALAEQYARWQERAEDVYQTLYLPFLDAMRRLTAHSAPSLLVNWAYTLWRELRDLPSRQCRTPAEESCFPKSPPSESAPGKARQRPVPAPDMAVRFSVLMPVYNPQPGHLREAVDSLLAQTWPHWELCMADDASPDPEARPLLEELAAKDPRIRVEYRSVNGHIAAATNTALDMARHGYAALMDQDDLLTPDALECMAAAISANPQSVLFYSDEDKTDDDGAVFFPYFKKDVWDVELLRGQNVVSHLSVYRTALLRDHSGFREGFPGAQDYDLLLRYCEDHPPEAMTHVPRALYHWRSHKESTAMSIEAKPEVLAGSLAALQAHLDRRGIAGTAEPAPETQHTRVRYRLPSPAPLLTCIVDLGGAVSLGPAMLEALSAKAAYPKLQPLFLYDAEADAAAQKRLDRLAEQCRDLRTLALPAALNWAERANAALAISQGKLLVFLEKGLTPLTQGWVEEMAAHCCAPGVGALGGKLLDGEARIVHLGHEVSAEGALFSLFRGLPREDPGYFAWAKLARSVPCVDSRCLMTHKHYLEETGGFDAALGRTAAMDFCLRLGERRLRTVATPFAEFLLTMGQRADWEDKAAVTHRAFLERWKDRLAPCNPHLAAGDAGWALYWGETPASSSPRLRETPDQLQHTELQAGR